MYNADDFVKMIKKTAVEAVDASKPTNVVFGKVISVSPLKIRINQKLILGESQLVLSRSVTNYRLSVTMNFSTEYEKDDQNLPQNPDHKHDVIGTKIITVNNALKKDEEVILVQVSGGQKYIVIDRIG